MMGVQTAKHINRSVNSISHVIRIEQFRLRLRLVRLRVRERRSVCERQLSIDAAQEDALPWLHVWRQRTVPRHLSDAGAGLGSRSFSERATELYCSFVAANGVDRPA